MTAKASHTHRLRAALFAGGIAICINTALLSAADAIHFTTARGGLLRLVNNLGGQAAGAFGFGDFWSHAVLPTAAQPWFQTGFHLLIGLVMALFYAYALERRLPGGPLAKFWRTR